MLINEAMKSTKAWNRYGTADDYFADKRKTKGKQQTLAKKRENTGDLIPVSAGHTLLSSLSSNLFHV